MSKDYPEPQGVINGAEAIDEVPIELLAEPQIIDLSDRDMDALLEAIANPPPLTPAMERSIARWRERGSPM